MTTTMRAGLGSLRALSVGESVLRPWIAGPTSATGFGDELAYGEVEAAGDLAGPAVPSATCHLASLQSSSNETSCPWLSVAVTM